MLKPTLFISSALILVAGANAQILDLPDSFERFDISGVKLGDTPDTAIATLKERGYDCDFRGLIGPDGAPKNEHGNAGYLRCSTTDMVEAGRRSYARAEMDLFFGNLDLSGSGADASKVFVQKMVFKERYADQPNLDTMHARIQSKYAGAERRQGKWHARGQSAPDLEARQEAFEAKRKSCTDMRNQARSNGTTPEEQIEVWECELERAELNYQYLVGQPAQLTADYEIGRNEHYSTMNITAEWPSWLRVQEIHLQASNTAKSLEAKKAGPQIDDEVETTF